eukprot:TRINITY_DN8868_c0_g1_i11.p1 TRINITY_DN8868_c0_g1~~TRINITY_DN8868_c0_g1_i11.p1  ORF type:complete len:1151 (-),score=254.04 TRINITY_DN8868_c0_g1_i11:4-3360(-)
MSLINMPFSGIDKSTKKLQRKKGDKEKQRKPKNASDEIRPKPEIKETEPRIYVNAASIPRAFNKTPEKAMDEVLMPPPSSLPLSADKFVRSAEKDLIRGTSTPKPGAETVTRSLFQAKESLKPLKGSCPNQSELYTTTNCVTPSRSPDKTAFVTALDNISDVKDNHGASPSFKSIITKADLTCGSELVLVSPKKSVRFPDLSPVKRHSLIPENGQSRSTGRQNLSSDSKLNLTPSKELKRSSSKENQESKVNPPLKRITFEGLFPLFKRSKTDSLIVKNAGEVSNKAKLEASKTKSTPKDGEQCEEKADIDSNHELSPNLSTKVNTSWKFGDIDDILAFDCDRQDENSSGDVDPISPKTRRDMERDINELCFVDKTKCDQQEKSAKSGNENILNQEKSVKTHVNERLNPKKPAKFENDNKLNLGKSATFDNNNRLNKEKSAIFDNDNRLNLENPAKLDSDKKQNPEKSLNPDTVNNRRPKRHPVIGFKQHLKLAYKNPLRNQVMKKGRNKKLMNGKYPIPPATLVNMLSLIRTLMCMNKFHWPPAPPESAYLEVACGRSSQVPPPSQTTNVSQAAPSNTKTSSAKLKSMPSKTPQAKITKPGKVEIAKSSADLSAAPANPSNLSAGDANARKPRRAALAATASLPRVGNGRAKIAPVAISEPCNSDIAKHGKIRPEETSNADMVPQRDASTVKVPKVTICEPGKVHEDKKPPGTNSNVDKMLQEKTVVTKPSKALQMCKFRARRLIYTILVIAQDENFIKDRSLCMILKDIIITIFERYPIVIMDPEERAKLALTCILDFRPAKICPQAVDWTFDNTPNSMRERNVNHPLNLIYVLNVMPTHPKQAKLLKESMAFLCLQLMLGIVNLTVLDRVMFSDVWNLINDNIRAWTALQESHSAMKVTITIIDTLITTIGFEGMKKDQTDDELLGNLFADYFDEEERERIGFKLPKSGKEDKSRKSDSSLHNDGDKENELMRNGADNDMRMEPDMSPILGRLPVADMDTFDRSTMNNRNAIREMVGDILENVLDIVDTKIDDMAIDKSGRNRKTKLAKLPPEDGSTKQITPKKASMLLLLIMLLEFQATMIPKGNARQNDPLRLAFLIKTIFNKWMFLGGMIRG